MNYTELNEYQKSEVLAIILEDFYGDSLPIFGELPIEELRCEYPNTNDLAKMYSTKDIQELIGGHWLSYTQRNNPNDILPKDLVMDWDEFLIDYWKMYPEGYFVWMMESLELMEEDEG